MRHHHKKIIDVGSAIILLALIALDATMGSNVLADIYGKGIAPGLYFFGVTQGESILLVLPSGITILTDAGSDAGIVNSLQKLYPPTTRPYIDLAIISSPNETDYAGFHYLLQDFQIGAFIYNGRADTVKSAEWQILMAEIAAKHIPLITVGAGDHIHYADAAEIDILSPNASFVHSPDPGDTALVQHINTLILSAVLAENIGINVEGALLAPAPAHADVYKELSAKILKAPFPGLSSAAGDTFLRDINPGVIVTEPGEKGTASQPTKLMMARLASSTNAIIASPKIGSFLLYNK